MKNWYILLIKNKHFDILPAPSSTTNAPTSTVLMALLVTPTLLVKLVTVKVPGSRLVNLLSLTSMSSSWGTPSMIPMKCLEMESQNVVDINSLYFLNFTIFLIINAKQTTDPYWSVAAYIMILEIYNVVCSILVAIASALKEDSICKDVVRVQVFWSFIENCPLARTPSFVNWKHLKAAPCIIVGRAAPFYTILVRITNFQWGFTRVTAPLLNRTTTRICV